MTLWCIKGGSSGEREKRMLDKSLIGIGWEELGNLSEIKNKNELEVLYKKTYPDANNYRIGNQVGQLWIFLNTIKINDIVVVPLKTQSSIAIGRVTSDYEYKTDLGEDMKHVRKVHWIKEDLSRTVFEQDLLYSFGAFKTVCQISRNDAERRIEAIIQNKKPSLIIEGKTDESEETKDIEIIARDQIREYINRRFKGHELTRLVEAVLKAKGLFTKMMPVGADGGKDILAGTGTMGFDEPKLCVQVKSSDLPVDVTILRGLKGTMQDCKATQGLLVSWGGFKRSVESEADNTFFHIRLWDSEGLIQAIEENYNKLPQEIQTELPFKKIWTLVNEGEE